MPRFHFHFRQHGRLEEDTIGIEFPTVEAAYLSAFEAARDIWRDLLCEREDPTACSFEVRNSDNQRIFELPFLEVLEACRRPGGRPAPQPRRDAPQPITEPRVGEYLKVAIRRLAETNHDAQHKRREVKFEIERAHAALAESNRLLKLLGQY